MTPLTRNDNGFDSIAWAFSEHVKRKDTGKFNYAILYGNEDAPEKIQFWTSSNPNYNSPPNWTWSHSAGTSYSRGINPSDLGLFYVYFNGEFYYASADDHYKHGRPVGNKWYPTMAEARAEAEKLNKKSNNPRRKRRMMPIVAANPELLLLGNPRRRKKSRRSRRRNGKLRLRSYRRRRRNGGQSKGLHKHWGPITKHKRRVNRGRRGGYAGFVKKHKGLFKRMTFKQATKKISQMWRKSH